MTRIRLDENDNALLARLASAKHPGTLVATHTDAAWLMKVWSVTQRATRHAAQLIFPREGGVKAVETLCAMAAARASELSCQAKGSKRGAAAYAQHVALYLEELPDWAK